MDRAKELHISKGYFFICPCASKSNLIKRELREFLSHFAAISNEEIHLYKNAFFDNI